MDKKLLGELLVSGVSAPKSAARIWGVYASVAGWFFFSLPLSLLGIIPAE